MDEEERVSRAHPRMTESMGGKHGPILAGVVPFESTGRSRPVIS